MLLRYFGLSEDPFGVTPDPRLFYRSHTHREAMASLQYGFYSNRGFLALIGPPGIGKTTLLYRFLDEIRDSARTVFLFNTQCEAKEIVRYILHDLGITPERDSVEMHAQLNAVLLAEARAGRKFVLVIDEAQNLSDAALETVRLLTNFETRRAKLIQIVLAGQPQLSDKLMSPSLVQLRQRISTVCRVGRLSMEDTDAYIEHRLKLAGYQGAPLFTKGALRLITEASQGIPRAINNLCFNALSLCCALKRKQVDCAMTEEVIADQQLPPSLGETCALSSEAVAREQHFRPKHRHNVQRLVETWALVATVLLGMSVLGALHLRKPGDTRFNRKRDDLGSLGPKIQPVSGMTSAGDTTHNSTAAEPTPKVTPVVITVGPNQTLRSIAIQYLGNFDQERLRQIEALNPELIDPDYIQPGQKIRVPGPVAENARSPASERNLP